MVSVLRRLDALLTLPDLCPLQAELLRCEMDAARGAVWAALAMLDAFPTLLAPLQPAAHLLAGCYCHSVAAYSAAAAHFGEAMRRAAGEPMMRTLASALQVRAGPWSTSQSHLVGLLRLCSTCRHLCPHLVAELGCTCV